MDSIKEWIPFLLILQQVL